MQPDPTAAAALALDAMLTTEMREASARMDANKNHYPAYRNAQADYCQARDAREQLRHAVDPEGHFAAAESASACASAEYHSNQEAA